ncbi:MAG: hypothetical protein ACT4O5_10340 [Gammaproteobacteria bacterium]
MSRSVPSMLAFAAVCLSAGATAHADSTIPGYFFKEWIISRDCSEQHAGPAGHVRTGLKFRVAPSSRDADGGSYALEALDVDRRIWPGSWKKVRLEYRAGAKMTTLPADFECVPGQEASSPFLALANYSLNAEPWYEFEHWYGILLVHDEPHHVLIFPRDRKGASSAIIILQDADASGAMKLDHNGSIHSED